MGMADEIKAAITMDDVCRQYGFEVGRGGFVRCPFHSGDRTASLKVYPGDRGWHCFGCNKGGSVISFVMELFGLNFKQALVRMNQDFNLGLTQERPARHEYLKVIEERRREQEIKETAESLFRLFASELHYQKEIADVFRPVRTENQVYYHPFYVEAIKRIPLLEHWLDDYIEEGGGKEWLRSLNLPGMIT